VNIVLAEIKPQFVLSRLWTCQPDGLGSALPKTWKNGGCRWKFVATRAGSFFRLV